MRNATRDPEGHESKDPPIDSQTALCRRRAWGPTLSCMEQPDVNEVAHRFDPQTFDWNDAYSGTIRDCVPPDPRTLAVAAQISAGRALDVGCGAGGLAIELARRGFSVTGVDIAKRAIAAARATPTRVPMIRPGLRPSFTLGGRGDPAPEPSSGASAGRRLGDSRLARASGVSPTGRRARPALDADRCRGQLAGRAARVAISRIGARSEMMNSAASPPTSASSTS